MNKLLWSVLVGVAIGMFTGWVIWGGVTFGIMGPTCLDGARPDKNGCCTDEVYTDMGNLGFNCCPPGDGDCFPPIK